MSFFSKPLTLERVSRWAFWMVLAVLTLLVLFIHRDFGVSWDEPTRHEGGAIAWEYYRSGAMDSEKLNRIKNPAHGVLFDLIAASVSPESGEALYNRRHLLNALSGLAAVAAAGILAGRAFGPPAAPLAMLFLMLTPSWFGHLFMNPKDIPFAAAFILSVLGINQMVRELPRPRWRTAVGLGLAIGAALGIRLIGVALFILLGLVLAWNAIRYRTRPQSAQTVWRWVGLLGVVYLVGHLVMVFSWPWGWNRPFHFLFHALGESREFTWEGMVTYQGQKILGTDLPRGAMIHLLGVRIPIPILLGALGGFGVSLVHALGMGGRTRRVLGLLLSGLLFIPPLYLVFSNTIFYDGIRHVLFVLPFAAILAAGAAVTGAQWLETLRPGRGWIAGGLLILAFLAPTAMTMIRLHPYQYVFHNARVGGVPEAEGRYDLEYWLTSYREAVEELKRLEPEGAHAVYVFGQPLCATPFFPPEWRLVDSWREADFLILSTRDASSRHLPGTVRVRIERMGVPFTVVKDVRNL